MQFARNVGTQCHDRFSGCRGEDEGLGFQVTTRKLEMNMDLVALAVDHCSPVNHSALYAIRAPAAEQILEPNEADVQLSRMICFDDIFELALCQRRGDREIKSFAR